MIIPIFRCQSRSIVRRIPSIRRIHTPIRPLPEWRTLHPYHKTSLALPTPSLLPRQQRIYNSTAGATSAEQNLETWALPETCHGCGALTQWVYPKEPGYYTVTRKPVKQYIRQVIRDKESNETALVDSEVGNKAAPESKEVGIPLCDRCHNLINHGEGDPIPYPTLSYIRDLIEESPFHNNYVYHVVDAADFPLSVISNLDRHVPLQPQRSQNRRSHTKKYGSSRHLSEPNFIITRADLLSNVKPQADSLMKDMVEILRQNLDRKEHGIRLGNVHMVSSYRGWWTKEIKEDIWNRGGGVWMVGKVNVGKSKLITSVFPKSAPTYKAKKLQNTRGVTVVGRSSAGEATAPQFEELEDDDAGAPVLLPPLQKEVPFPNLPIDSIRPGTTASPIRIPFDKHRGEVIDLPGLFRSGLDEFVQDKHRSDLVMTSRPRPTQLSIKPTQSLLLGGLIGIKPLEEKEVVLASPFVSLEAHVTHKDKAVEMLAQQRECPNGNIAKEGIGEQITSAGIVELKYDVTSRYAKPLASGGLPQLYRIMGIDILIEGCGWVELTCEVRTRTRAPDDFPKVELFSPQGKFVGSRMPLSTYAFSLKHRAQEENKRITRSRRPSIKTHRPKY
ncbi:Mitochondrial ribosome small subunit biogenesis protein [Microsporum ferrugineum]